MSVAITLCTWIGYYICCHLYSARFFIKSSSLFPFTSGKMTTSNWEFLLLSEIFAYIHFYWHAKTVLLCKQVFFQHYNMPRWHKPSNILAEMSIPLCKHCNCTRSREYRTLHHTLVALPTLQFTIFQDQCFSKASHSTYAMPRNIYHKLNVVLIWYQ